MRSREALAPPGPWELKPGCRIFLQDRSGEGRNDSRCLMRRLSLSRTARFRICQERTVSQRAGPNSIRPETRPRCDHRPTTLRPAIRVGRPFPGKPQRPGGVDRIVVKLAAKKASRRAAAAHGGSGRPGDPPRRLQRRADGRSGVVGAAYTWIARKGRRAPTGCSLHS